MSRATSSRRPGAAAAAAAALALLGAGCGSSERAKTATTGQAPAPTVPVESKTAARGSGGPAASLSAAEVGAASGGLHTARFAGIATTKAPTFTDRLELRGRIDRDHLRSEMVVVDHLSPRVPGATRTPSHTTTTEYRVLGNTAYIRMLAPRPQAWLRQDLRAHAPGDSIPYAVASGGIFGFR